MQKQMALAAYFTKKQILPFAFEEQYRWLYSLVRNRYKFFALFKRTTECAQNVCKDLYETDKLLIELGPVCSIQHFYTLHKTLYKVMYTAD